jgi:hypothetical protein
MHATEVAKERGEIVTHMEARFSELSIERRPMTGNRSSCT